MLPAILVAIGCAQDAPESATELSADLRKDLELASSAGLELASSQSTAERQIVSAIEAPQSAPVARKPSPRRVARPKASPIQNDETAPEPVDAVAAQPEPEAPVELAANEEPPVAAPRPTAPQVPLPSGGVGAGGGAGRGRGGWGGVVIRGGSGGIDHCERRPRGGRGGIADAVIGAGVTIFVNDRGPRIGISNPTFPRW